jgi:hypothetical protein
MIWVFKAVCVKRNSSGVFGSAPAVAASAVAVLVERILLNPF